MFELHASTLLQKPKSHRRCDGPPCYADAPTDSEMLVVVKLVVIVLVMVIVVVLKIAIEVIIIVVIMVTETTLWSK